MKRFILRFGCFAAIVLAVLGGVCAVEVVAEIRAYRQEVIAPCGASVLLCGDSQLAHGVDPSVCPAFFNFSADGRTLDQAYLTMLDVLDAPANRGRIRQVVFDVSPASLVWRSGKPIGDLDFAGRYWLVHLLHPKASRAFRSFGGWVRVARDNLVGRRFRLLWRAARGKATFKSSLCGGFWAMTDVGMDSPETFAKTVAFKARQSDGFDAVDVGDFPYRVLEKVVAAAQARGVEVVLVSTPWHADLVRACGEASADRFARRLSAFAAARQCRYVSFLRTAFPPSDWLDANLLNVRGAAKFTKLLAETLEKKGRTTNE